MSAFRRDTTKCLLLLPFLFSVAGCGSKSAGSGNQPQQLSIKLNQSTATVVPGGTQQFTATVSGSSNTSVTWSVDNVAGGNTSTGSVSSTGLYTAPQTSGSHVVTATSVADTAKNASAAVTVEGNVALSPSTATVITGATQQFEATVSGKASTSITWSVDGVSGGNSTVGTISTAGVYTAPAQPGSHTVTASSGSDAADNTTAAITVFTFSISPSPASLAVGMTQQFTASLQGLANSGVTWSVDGVAGGNTASGTIGSSGLYTAPTQTGTHTVTANSAADTAASVSATVNVLAPLIISPTSATLLPSASQQFTASATGVSWSVDGIAGGNSSTGTINSSGLYTAPSVLGAHTITATSATSSSITGNAGVTVINAQVNAVLTYHNDDARDGAFTQEVTLKPSNVNSTQFGKLVSYPVDGQIYGQPLYVPNLTINGGSHDVVFVATQNNTLYAFDADATSANPSTFWQVNLGTPVGAYDAGGPWPTVGIFSTPVIDITTNAIYVVAHVASVSPEYWLHSIDITTGKDNVGPAGISGASGSDSLGNGCYQRMGLALNPTTNWIYVPYGSCPSGWLFAYDKSTLQQKAVFDVASTGGGAGLWGSGTAPAIDDSTGDVYVMSGTDAGDQQWISTNSMVGYNDSFLRIKASDLSVIDYFAPDDNSWLAQNDADLGSGGNVIIPGSPTYPDEILGGGKDGNVFVINRDSMGGYNSSSNNVLQTVHMGPSQFDNIFSTPVYWNGNLYFHPNGDVLHAFSWTAGANEGQQMSTAPTSSGSTTFNSHGATPSLSANGNNNGIIWEIDNSGYNNTNPTASAPAVLHAYNATNLSTELYNSAQAGTRDQAGLALKFTVPTIANGRVFVPTGSELDIYGLLSP